MILAARFLRESAVGNTTTWDIAFSILASLGGGAAIVLAFSAYFGRLFATHLAQKQNEKILHKLEEIQSQLALVKSEKL